MMLQPAFVRPAAQAMMPSSYRVDCAQWLQLSLAAKLTYATSIRPRNPQAMVRVIDSSCIARVRPAGQPLAGAFGDILGGPFGAATAGVTTAESMISTATGQHITGVSSVTVNPDGTSSDSSGQTYDENGNPIPGGGPPAPIPMPPPPGGTVTPGPGYTPPSGTDIGKAPGTYPSMSPQDQQNLFNAVSGALNTTGQMISNAFATGNQVQLAQLQTQTQTQIAAFQSQAQQAQAAGNLALAQQRATQAAQLQQFNALIQANRGSNTALYVVGGVVVAGLIGLLVYFGGQR